MPTVARTLRVARRIVRSAAGQTDHGRWRILAQNPHYSTDLRNRAVGELVPPGSSVLDLGCGVQTLRRFLPADTEYQPCDLVEDVPGVLYCDFNAGIRPPITKKFDFAVCSGVLEFLREPKDFLRRAPELGRTLILAYFPLEQRGRGRVGR